ncbi:MAG TPA: CHAD domain-containing protein [Candidatus Obscuribacter sp.]|nr:CHAD domain-containing protein [Candidatus Obscuribacter sp.]
MSTLVKAVPEHLLNLNWFELEEARALSVYEELSGSLGGINHKLSPKLVHELRVVIRRWYSIWEILELDNWQDKYYEKKIKSPLEKINKHLGGLRDMDVNIELAADFQAPSLLIASWRKKRAKLRRKAAQAIQELKPGKIDRRLAEHLSRRAYELERLLIPLPEDQGKKTPSITYPFKSPLEKASYHHIDVFLLDCEAEAKTMAARELSAEELHELRLVIKRWRYLLTEFFGVSNIELVRAQQLLGRHHDLVRLKEALLKYEKKRERKPARDCKKRELSKEQLAEQKSKLSECLSRVSLELNRVDDEIKRVKQELPYGLRPYRVSPLIG